MSCVVGTVTPTTNNNNNNIIVIIYSPASKIVPLRLQETIMMTAVARAKKKASSCVSTKLELAI